MGVHAVIGEAVRTVRPPKALCGRCFCSVRGRLLLTAEEATQHCECTDTDAHGDNSHQRHEESFKSHKIVFHALNLPQTHPERAQNQRLKHSGCSARVQVLYPPYTGSDAGSGTVLQKPRSHRLKRLYEQSGIRYLHPACAGSHSCITAGRVH